MGIFQRLAVISTLGLMTLGTLVTARASERGTVLAPRPASLIAAPAGGTGSPTPARYRVLMPLLESGRVHPGDLGDLLREDPMDALRRRLGPASPTINSTCIELDGIDGPPRPDSLDALHYTIVIDAIDETAATFRGRTTVRLRALRDVPGIDLNFADLQITEVRVGLPRTAVPYTHDAGILHLDLSGDFLQDTEVEAEIAYEGISPTCLNTRGIFSGFVFTRSGVHTFGEPTFARHWFPCLDVPWDKATATLTVTVPAGRTGSAAGVLIDQTQENGLDKLTWSIPEAVSTYLMAIYVSDYTLIDEVSPGGVPLEYFVYPALAESSRIDFQNLPDMVDFYSSIHPYPNPRYAMTLGFFGGGMEHQMNSLIGEFFIRGNQEWESLFSHELAHQWWGDLVTTKTWREIWLNEGFATYFEWIYDEHRYGWDRMREDIHFIDSLYIARRDDIDHPILDPVPDNIFSFVVYQKGGRVLDMLRGVSRLHRMDGPPRPPEDWTEEALAGDARFFAIFDRYATAHAQGSVTTEDFRNAAEAELGEDLGWFFSQWLEGKAYPQLAYDYVTTETPTGVDLNVYILQAQTWEDRYRMPLQVRYISGSTILDEVRPLQGNDSQWVVSLPPGEWTVQLDPDNWLLEEHNHLDLFPAARRIGVFPNPSASGFNILASVDGARAQKVSLEVFDVQGRLVRTQSFGTVDPGPLGVRWDGRADDGQAVRPGAYFLRLQLGPRIVNQRLIVLP